MLQDYQVLVAFTNPVNNAVLQIGDILSLESNLGEKLCRCGKIKNVTTIPDTLEERVGVLEEIDEDNALTLEP